MIESALKAARWIGSKPNLLANLTHAGVGGVAGLAASGGSFWGAAAGAALGGIAGRQGISYHGRIRGQKYSNLTSKWGNAIAKAYPGKAGNFAMTDIKLLRNVNGGANISLAQRIHPAVRKPIQPIHPGMGNAFEGRQAAAGMLGIGMTAGLGIGAGITSRIASHFVGSSFGSERRSHYGTTFSGMGNGSY